MSARTTLILVVALAIVASLAIAWTLWRPGGTRSARGDWYEVYFTEPRYPDRAETHKGGIDEHLVKIVDGAQRTVEMAIYDFDLQNVADALARAKQRGVTVRMVTDTDTVESNDQKVKAALQTVRAASIPIVDDQRRAIMHHKFVVVDGEIVLTGSWNFTDGDTYRLNNNAVRIASREMAANFTAEFEKMFGQRKFGPTKPKGVPHPSITLSGSRVETWFASEDDPSERLVELVRGARSRIDFLAFSFTHEAIGEAVLERARSGVKVRGVFENTGSNTRFSEYGKMAGAKLEVYQDGNPYVMHHKVFVVDGRYTVFGSFNFSDNASSDNDENMLIVDDPTFARLYTDEVDRVVALAQKPLARR